MVLVLPSTVNSAVLSQVPEPKLMVLVEKEPTVISITPESMNLQAKLLCKGEVMLAE